MFCGAGNFTDRQVILLRKEVNSYPAIQRVILLRKEVNSYPAIQRVILLHKQAFALHTKLFCGTHKDTP